MILLIVVILAVAVLVAIKLRAKKQTQEQEEIISNPPIPEPKVIQPSVIKVPVSNPVKQVTKAKASNTVSKKTKKHK